MLISFKSIVIENERLYGGGDGDDDDDWCFTATFVEMVG